MHVTYRCSQKFKSWAWMSHLICCLSTAVVRMSVQWLADKVKGWISVPVVVGHGSCLQRLGGAWVYQRTVPVIVPIVPCVCDMYDVITGNTHRWRFSARLHVEIDAHVEGVSTSKQRRSKLWAQLRICWKQEPENTLLLVHPLTLTMRGSLLSLAQICQYYNWPGCGLGYMLLARVWTTSDKHHLGHQRASTLSSVRAKG